MEDKNFKQIEIRKRLVMKQPKEHPGRSNLRWRRHVPAAERRRDGSNDGSGALTVVE